MYAVVRSSTASKQTCYRVTFRWLANVLCFVNNLVEPSEHVWYWTEDQW